MFFGVRGEQRGIWRMNPDGTEPRLVAAVPTAAFFDTTPDGQWILFTSDHDGSFSFWRVASGGGTIERVVDRLERASLSPSGDRAVGVLARGNRYGVAVLPLAGGEPTWIPSDSAATGMGGIFQWAPDGKGVYFTTAERANLFFYRFGTPAQTNVTHLTPDAIIFNGAISRDGRTMLVTRGAQGRDAFMITNFH